MRNNLKIWTNLIYRWFYNNNTRKFGMHIRDEICIRSYMVDDEELPEISMQEFRRCVNYIRNVIIPEKLDSIAEKKAIEIAEIPPSYYKSLFWISATSAGYKKTYDIEVALEHKKALVKRQKSLTADINNVNKLVSIYKIIDVKKIVENNDGRKRKEREDTDTT